MFDVGCSMFSLGSGVSTHELFISRKSLSARASQGEGAGVRRWWLVSRCARPFGEWLARMRCGAYEMSYATLTGNDRDWSGQTRIGGFPRGYSGWPWRELARKPDVALGRPVRRHPSRP